MAEYLFCILSKLRLLAFVSTIWVGQGQAHEVLPALADLRADQGTVTVELTVNLEALLAGIDLDGLTDTDEAEGAADYDALRARPAPEIASRAGALLPRWNELPLIRAGDSAVALQLQASQTEEIANLELPRLTTIRVTGQVPPGVETLVVAWPKGDGSLVLRQQGVPDPYTGFIDPGASSPEIDLQGGGAPSGWESFVRYIAVGFDHILPKGLDHILFVLGLFFLSPRLGPLLWQVSAFTLAHTVTLAMGALGWVNLPGSVVEPLIAASIVYVALENTYAAKLTPWRPAIVFAFGLLHGLGFASVLGAFGLPTAQFIPALIGFNVGVELGQLAVIAMAFVLVGWAGGRDWYRKVIAIPASLVIAAIGTFWVIERTLL